MIETFFATLTPMLTLFTCLIIGYTLNKTKAAPDNTATVLSKLENYVIVPALVVNTFMKYCTVESLKKEYSLVLYCAAVLLLALLIAIPLSRAFVKDGYRRNIYKYALTFGNFGFMGNAIVPAILGEEALYYYMLYTLPLNTAVYTWGLYILIPKDKNNGSVLKSIVNPIFIAILVGIVLGLTGATKFIPEFLSSTISSLASCMGPLAMVLSGFVIAGYDIKGLLSNKKVYVATFLRLVALPLLFVGLLWLAGASETVIVLTLFAYATPLGINTVVFPAAYGGDTKTGASMASISHTLCVISIPLLYAFVTSVMR